MGLRQAKTAFGCPRSVPDPLGGIEQACGHAQMEMVFSAMSLRAVILNQGLKIGTSRCESGFPQTRACTTSLPDQPRVFAKIGSRISNPLANTTENTKLKLSKPQVALLSNFSLREPPYSTSTVVGVVGGSAGALPRVNADLILECIRSRPAPKSVSTEALSRR